MSSDPILAIAAAGPPDFVTADGAALLATMKATFESLTGRSLSNVQVEMLLLETAAYMLSVRAIEENHAISQCFVAWAEGDWLDVHGADRGMPRLESARATITMRLTRSIIAQGASNIPAGTRVTIADVEFQITSACVLTSAQPSVEVLAEAVASGATANGLGPGFASLLDPVAGVGSVEAVNASSGGADRESDERYRARLATALQRINRGGTRAAYRSVVLDWSASVQDVAIVRPTPGQVYVYPLMPGGAPSAEEIASLTEWLAEDRAPLCASVSVLPPEPLQVNFVLSLQLSDPTAEPRVTMAVDAVLSAWRSTLGGLAAPSDIIVAAKSVAGVLDASVNFSAVPAADHQWREGSYTVEVLS